MEKIKTQLLIIKFFRAIGLESIAWSLRRLHCPVDKNELFLEVGSGGNPYSRANVLLDSYEEPSERYWVPLKVDRPMVLGFGEKFPFKERLKDFTLNTVRLALFQKIRNKKIHLFNLLLCQSCRSTFLLKIPGSIKCNDCNTTYQLRRSIPTMFPHV